jgi:cystathionine gamma-synthase
MKHVTKYINIAHLDTNSTIGSQKIDSQHGSPLTPSINFSSAYVFRTVEDLLNYHKDKYNSIRYTRDGTEIVLQVEKYFEFMHSESKCILFESGMSAISSALSSVISKNCKVITFGNNYRKTKQIIDKYEEMGVIESINYIRYDDLKAKPIKDKKIIFFIESPSNPFLRLANIADIRKHYPDAIIILDFTLQGLLNDKNSFDFADILVTSCTKYIGGHNDLIGGLVVLNTKKYYEKIWAYRSMHGGNLDAISAFLLLRSLRTYDMRISTILSNTKKVLKFLESEENIVKIYYPGHYENSDQNILFTDSLYHGGGVITVESAHGIDLKSNIEKLKSIKMAPSFGSVDTLVEMPLYMSYWGASKENLCSININERIVRLSIGCEPIEFIISDIKRLFKI